MSIELVLGLDLETTGLDENKDGILECCLKVVRPDFEVVAENSIFIRQPQEVLDRMSPAVRAQHQKSGLLADVEKYGIEPHQGDLACRAFVIEYWGEVGKPLLLGNSIHFDRRFLKVQMPEMEKLLHYRMIDVSAMREAVRVFGAKHRADTDVDNSIAELKLLIGRLQ